MANTVWQNILVVGLGSQGKAWALNLRDQKWTVSCYLRKSSSKSSEAKALGFNLTENFNNQDALLLLIPDNAHLNFLENHIEDIPEGTNIIYAHGASALEHKLIELFPQWNHILLAPKAIASEVRQAGLSGGGIGAVYSLEGVKKNQQEVQAEVLRLAKDLGVSAGPFEVTFAQEARADLLSEQSLLCGLIPYAAKACFEQLVKAGIPKELAYLEAWHEVKLIGNAMADKGPVDFYKLISPHALVGGQMSFEKIFNQQHQETIEQIKEDIWSGQFFKEVKNLNFDKQREIELSKWSQHPLNKVYDQLRDDLSIKDK